MSWSSVGLSCFVVCVVTAGIQANDLRVGAFNIQVLGTRKVSDTGVMDLLVKIIRRYDLLLVQEIRDKSETAIYNLLNATNEGQVPEKIFSMTISERLGRSSSKEQYAFFYRKGAGLSVLDAYTYHDTVTIEVNGTTQEVDIFEREPYIVKFRSSNTILGQFALVGVHVAPGDAVHEIQKLEHVVYDSVAKLNVSDVMVMGDLNAGCTYVTKSEWETITWKTNSDFTWLIGDDVDTTVKGTSCPYDRLIDYGPGWDTGIIPGSPVVYKFDQDVATLGEINQTMAEDISDHYPVEFKLKSRTGIIYIYHVYVSLPINGRLQTEVKYRVKPPAHAAISWNVYNLTDTAFSNPLAHLRNEKEDEAMLLSQLENIAQNSWYEELSVIPIKRRYRMSQRVKLKITVPLEHVTDVENAVQPTCESKSYHCVFEH